MAVSTRVAALALTNAAAAALLITTGGLAAAPTTANAGASHVSAAADTTSCADVFFLGARGSGQPQTGLGSYNGLGPQVNAARTELERVLATHRTVAAKPVVFAAASVVELKRPSVYFDGLDIGVGNALQILRARATTCPDERIVLAGYSQGAMVMHRLAFELSQDPAIFQRVDGVLLLADGDRVPKDNVHTYGSASPASTGIGYLLDAISHTNERKLPEGIGGRVHSVCNRLDPVCDSKGVGADLAFVKVHFTYTATSPVKSAVAKIAASVLRTPAPKPKVRSITAQAGTPISVTLKADVATGYTLQWRVRIPFALPQGLRLSAAGRVTGVPASALPGSTIVEVRAYDTGFSSTWVASTLKWAAPKGAAGVPQPVTTAPFAVPQTNPLGWMWPADNGWWLFGIVSGDGSSGTTMQWVGPDGDRLAAFHLDYQVTSVIAGLNGVMYASGYNETGRAVLHKMLPDDPDVTTSVPVDQINPQQQTLALGVDGKLYWHSSNRLLQLDATTLKSLRSLGFSADNFTMTATTKGLVLVHWSGAWNLVPYSQFVAADGFMWSGRSLIAGVSRYHTVSVGRTGAVATLEDAPGHDCQDATTTYEVASGASWKATVADFATGLAGCIARDVDVLPDGNVVYTVTDAAGETSLYWVSPAHVVIRHRIIGSATTHVWSQNDGAGNIVTVYTEWSHCASAMGAELCPQAHLSVMSATGIQLAVQAVGTYTDSTNAGVMGVPSFAIGNSAVVVYTITADKASVPTDFSSLTAGVPALTAVPLAVTFDRTADAWGSS
ncbi:MAG: cutinase [Frankiales bacterium]|nr:cutinase [Frankiales bacterium]